MANLYWSLHCETCGWVDGYTYTDLITDDDTGDNPPSAICPVNAGHGVTADSMRMIGSDGMMIPNLEVNKTFRSCGENEVTRVIFEAGATGVGAAPLKITAGPLMSTPELGAMEYYDDGTTGHFYFTVNQVTSPIAKATGGTISYSGLYVIHTFTGNANFTPTENITVSSLCIGGGGGGGGNVGGGGGGGGFLQASGDNVTVQAYPVVIGGVGSAGGAGGDGGTGGNSTFNGHTGLGGGGGGHFATAGAGGGCGGGGGGRTDGGLTNGGSGSPGKDGGKGTGQNNYAGGGGGGGDEAGQNGGLSQTDPTYGGHGGGGYIPSPVIPGQSTHYGGGGGGGGYIGCSGGTASDGGGAGGGNGSAVGGNAGTANTGGGGGAGAAGNGSGAAGGTGVVIVWYQSGSVSPTRVQIA